MSEDFFLADDFYELKKSSAWGNLSMNIGLYDITVEEQINFFVDLCSSLNIKTQELESKKYHIKKCDLQYHTIDFLHEDIDNIINNITYVIEFSSLYYNCQINNSPNSPETSLEPSPEPSLETSPAGWNRLFYFYVENLTMNKCKIYYQYSFNVDYYIELSNKFINLLNKLDYEEKIFSLLGKPGEKYMSFTLHDFSEKSCENLRIYINALKEGLHKRDKDLKIFYYFQLNDGSYLTKNFTLHFTDVYFIKKYDRR